MEVSAEPRWPPGLAVMKTIDDLSRCGICFEYFNIAVIIPQCSHNYCSLCIRKFLSYKTQCPTCCVAVTEPDSRNNRLLDESVKSMNFARTHSLQFALESPPISPVSSTSKKVVVKVHNADAAQHPVKQANRLMDKFSIRETGDCVFELLGKENERKFSPQKELSTSAEIKETSLLGKPVSGLSDANGPVTPSTSTMKSDTKVSCPVCGVSIPENHINKHLDSCLSREEKKESSRSSAHKRKPLPKTVYNLLSDRDLKKKSKQYGLSVQGNKQQLIKRHQEFVHMYNAQCDALHPKSAAEIVQEIESMEKTRMRLEASKLNENVMVFTKNQTEKEIEEVHSEYRKKHQNAFQLSVDQAKKGYKKTGRVSQAAAMRTDEPAETSPSMRTDEPAETSPSMRTDEPAETSPLMRADEPAETSPSECIAQEDNVSFSDTVSVTNHFPQPQSDSPGPSEPERPDDSSSCTDILFSSDSDSCNRNDQNREVSPQQTRRTRASECVEIEPRNKRNKN